MPFSSNPSESESPAAETRAPHSVCVFCASSPGVLPVYIDEAKILGRTIAECGWRLVYGGAHVGLMGAVADAALAHGGPVTGVIPGALVDREIAHTGLTELIEVRSMHERKAEMASRSDAFIALPGGLGTLDELCEMLTWGLLGIHQKPIVLINTAGYWNSFLTMLDEAVRAGFLRPAHRSLALLAPDAQQACRMIETTWLK